jgi:hypothetical protein
VESRLAPALFLGTVNLFGTLKNVYPRTVVTPFNGNDIAHWSHTQSRSDVTYVATGLPVADRIYPVERGAPPHPASPVGATPNASPVNVFGCSGESLPFDYYRLRRMGTDTDVWSIKNTDGGCFCLGVAPMGLT